MDLSGARVRNNAAKRSARGMRDVSGDFIEERKGKGKKKRKKSKITESKIVGVSRRLHTERPLSPRG